MLLELAVRDLAQIERAHIWLAPGFTVITGETGAGKSLLIDALALVLDGRADASLIRHGADVARVEALVKIHGQHEQKQARDGRTVTDVRPLDGAERETELAQMLGGTAADAGARAAAVELLSRAARLQQAASAVG